MKTTRNRWFAGLAVFAMAGLMMGQAKVSKKEFDAYNAVMAAATDDARIAAADQFVTGFADSKLKSVVLLIAAQAAERKNDIPKAIVYAQSSLEADPKNYQAMILIAGELARGTRENDLDKEEKLTRADKLANEAIATVKEAPKPNDKLTDDQWGAYKKDFESQAHEDLGMSAMARKKYDLGISEFKMAVDMSASPNPSTMIRLAAAYDTAKMPDEALATLAKVYALPNIDAGVKAFADREKAVADRLKAAKK
jgi:tetratricopeptide (TPR) repeat protein